MIKDVVLFNVVSLVILFLILRCDSLQNIFCFKEKNFNKFRSECLKFFLSEQLGIFSKSLQLSFKSKFLILI